MTYKEFCLNLEILFGGYNVNNCYDYKKDKKVIGFKACYNPRVSSPTFYLSKNITVQLLDYGFFLYKRNINSQFGKDIIYRSEIFNNYDDYYSELEKFKEKYPKDYLDKIK